MTRVATVLIDTSSPERGWQPFIDWMAAQGLDARNAVAIEINAQAMTAEVTEWKHRHGKPYVDATGDVARKKRTVRISSLPPRRHRA